MKYSENVQHPGPENTSMDTLIQWARFQWKVLDVYEFVKKCIDSYDFQKQKQDVDKTEVVVICMLFSIEIFSMGKEYETEEVAIAAAQKEVNLLQEELNIKIDMLKVREAKLKVKKRNSAQRPKKETTVSRR